MITKTLPQELMDEIRTLEESYPVQVGIQDIPFTKCDWATANVLVVLSFSFSEAGRRVISNAGSDIWIKIKSVSSAPRFP